MRSEKWVGVSRDPLLEAMGQSCDDGKGLLVEYTEVGGECALAAGGMADFNSGMPAFEGVITDDEIWKILAYIRSTWPERMRETQANRNPQH